MTFNTTLFESFLLNIFNFVQKTQRHISLSSHKKQTCSISFRSLACFWSFVQFVNQWRYLLTVNLHICIEGQVLTCYWGLTCPLSFFWWIYILRYSHFKKKLSGKEIHFLLCSTCAYWRNVYLNEESFLLDTT